MVLAGADPARRAGGKAEPALVEDPLPVAREVALVVERLDPVATKDLERAGVDSGVQVVASGLGALKPDQRNSDTR